METQKNFALQLGALITLYVSIGSFITLMFGVITLSFPDDADMYYQIEGASESIRFAIATLIVVFPLYLWVTRKVNTIRRAEQGMYVTLTKWVLYLSLLVGGAILAGDVVSVVYTYLNGDITTRFLLKALTMAIVIGGAFFYYLKDAQGYWQTREKESLQYGAVVVVIVLIGIVLGFMHSETPAEVREMKIDNNQVGDLQDMQWRIEEYYRVHESLPESLETVYEGLAVPTAPEGRSAYAYKVVDEKNYQLCATFVTSSQNQNDEFSRPAVYMEKNYNWTHSEGEWCFERVIDNVYRQ